MHRFYVSHTPKKAEIITGDLYHQLSHVFRSKVGGNFILFTKGGNDFIYHISEIKKDHLIAVMDSSLEMKSSTKNTIALFHALPNKTNTIELIVEKLTELGISRVVFFSSARSQMAEVSENKKERIERIAIEALEQCWGNNPLLIEYSKDSLEAILKKENSLQHIIASQNGQKSLELKDFKNLALWIWPEGGWADEEQKFFEKKKLTQWSFATQILRLETAGIVGTGILQYLSK